MANDQVTTSSPGMQKAAQLFGSTIEQMNSDLKQVQTNVSNLMVSWTGRAATAFSSAMNPWYAEFQTVVRNLQEMQELMSGNMNLYDGTEEDNTGLAQNPFAAGLPGM